MKKAKNMVGAIIQARMTSTRLPGKVLLEINGRPMIDYLFERLEFCRNLQKIVLATTINKEDDSIVDYAKKRGILYFRGSEHDVLARYYKAAKQFGIDHVMRITADCPLIDPQLCDQVIDVYFKEKVDYVHTGCSFAEGLDCEFFPFRVLKDIYTNAKKKSEREHVSLYIKDHPELFKIITVQNKTDDSKYRFTIDELEDFEVVKAIINSLYQKDSTPFNAKEIKRFLENHPDIFRKNAHITRNEGLLISLKNDEVEAE